MEATATLRIRRTRLRSALVTLAFHLLILIAGVGMVYPLLWLLGSSFKAADEVWTNVAALVPRKPTLANY